MPNPMLNPVVGKTIGGAQDGTEVGPRANRTGELAIGAAHGTWNEAVRQGNMWTISTPSAGITVTANMLVSVASANAILGLYNKSAAGGVNLHVTRMSLVIASAATITNLVWGFNNVATLSPIPTGVARARNHKNLTANSASPGAVAFDGSVAVSGAAATDLFRPIVAGVVNTPLTVEEFDDDLWVPPGGFLGIFGDTVTTSTVVRGFITWEEVPS
jgi:hypothetical protein